ncbi:MAG: PrsW family intramembrane metalloprotease [Parcubacteria group bacterium]|nr:PrsW family intramembrane metalloprotease [Parcubacteria group bacterium]
MDFSLNTLLWAFLGGLLPVLLWLWFWLKEDRWHPEPARLIFFAFLAGMIAVPVALVLEQFADNYFSRGFLLLLVWAAIEELVKYFGAYFVAFRKSCIDKSRCLDETIDPVIYMVTVALGFAALENTLFLLSPLAAGESLSGIVMGNLRFIGATVLHVVASASIGFAIGFAFYKSPWVKRLTLFFGLCTAVLLHTAFNFSILLSEGSNLFLIFAVVWFSALVVVYLFERVKRIGRSRS